MRRIRGIVPIILIALIALSMPFLRGADSIFIDRNNQASVSGDSQGAIAITGFNAGTGGAVVVGIAEYLGTITNNFKNAVELDITVEVEFLDVDYTGADEPEWRNINIFVNAEELQFVDQTEGDFEEITASPIVLDPEEEIDIEIDGNSIIHIPAGTDLNDFLGVVRLSISGYDPDNGNFLFELNPVDDWRHKYFSNRRIEYLYPETEITVTNLTGQIDYLQFDPEDADAYDDWYEVINMAGNELVVEFEVPSSNLFGEQKITFLFRRTDNSDRDARITRLRLLQDGVQIDNNNNWHNVTSAVGEVVEYTFDAGDLNDISGANLQIQIEGGAAGGGANVRNYPEYGAIQWEAQLE